MTPCILGIDSGLCTFGLAVIDIFPSPKVRTVKVHRRKDERSPLKGTELMIVRAASLRRFLSDNWPDGVVGIGVEGLSVSPGMGTAPVKIGVAWGVLVAEADRRGTPIFQKFPSDVKVFLTGDRSASKEDVQKALKTKYGLSFDSFLKVEREHAADAVGAGLCVLAQDKAIMTAVNMFRNQQGNCSP